MNANCKINKTWFLIILLTFFSHKVFSQNEAKIAILIVDIQEDFTGKQAKMPVNSFQASKMIDNLNVLIKRFENENVKIIYVGNEFPKNSIYNLFRHNAAIEGSNGITLDKRLIVINENYFAKSKGDAFSNSALNHFLKEQGVSDVYISGLYAEACVFATLKGAFRNGYNSCVLIDCIATKNEKRKVKSIEKYQKNGFATATSKQLIKEVLSQ